MTTNETFCSVKFVRDDADPYSIAITKATSGVAYHCVLSFQEPHGEEYFESLQKVDAATHKEGVRGPIPLSHLEEWVAAKPSRHLLSVGPLPMTQDEIAQARAVCEWAVPRIGYDEVQCFRNWLHLVGHLIIRFGQYGSRKAWTCSEMCARALPSRFTTQYLYLGDLLYDLIVPSSAKAAGLYEALRLWHAGLPPAPINGYQSSPLCPFGQRRPVPCHPN